MSIWDSNSVSGVNTLSQFAQDINEPLDNENDAQYPAAWDQPESDEDDDGFIPAQQDYTGQMAADGTMFINGIGTVHVSLDPSEDVPAITKFLMGVVTADPILGKAADNTVAENPWLSPLNPYMGDRGTSNFRWVNAASLASVDPNLQQVMWQVFARHINMPVNQVFSNTSKKVKFSYELYKSEIVSGLNRHVMTIEHLHDHPQRALFLSEIDPEASLTHITGALLHLLCGTLDGLFARQFKHLSQAHVADFIWAEAKGTLDEYHKSFFGLERICAKLPTNLKPSATMIDLYDSSVLKDHPEKAHILQMVKDGAGRSAGYEWTTHGTNIIEGQWWTPGQRPLTETSLFHMVGNGPYTSQHGSSYGVTSALRHYYPKARLMESIERNHIASQNKKNVALLEAPVHFNQHELFEWHFLLRRLTEGDLVVIDDDDLLEESGVSPDTLAVLYAIQSTATSGMLAAEHTDHIAMAIMGIDIECYNPPVGWAAEYWEDMKKSL